jgi:hypothetical protein
MPKNTANRVLVGLFVCASIGLIGCGNATAPMAEVEGVVTLDGTPLPEAGIAFLPDAQRGAIGQGSHAVTDANGHFTLLAGTAGKTGAVLGWHKVVVEDYKAKAEHKPKGRVPARYESALGSGLEFEIKSGHQSFTVELKSK